MTNAILSSLIPVESPSTIRGAANRLLITWIRPCVLLTLACFGLHAAAQTGEWAWMSGTSTIPCTQPPSGSITCTYPVGVYGTLGTPAAGNVPGSRDAQVTWTDSVGNLWLFGGSGLDSTDRVNAVQLNDLWEFSPSSKEWTWKGGLSLVPYTGPAGVYGTLACISHKQ